MTELSEAEKGYIAGVIDGEGSFGTWKPNDEISPIVRLRIINTNKGFLERIQGILGMGHVSINRTNTKDSKRRTVYEYYLGKWGLKKLLPEILPYLYIKKERAKIVFEFISTGTHEFKKRDALSYTLSKLNRRGKYCEDIRGANPYSLAPFVE